MIQKQTWWNLHRILITNSGEGSIQVEHPMTPEAAHNHPVFRHAQALIYGLWVDKKFRGHGVGEALLKTAEKEALKDGAKSVGLVWDRRDSPKWVLEWYERCGYREVAFDQNQSLLVKEIGI